ncbi:MAG: response regulator transcription factor [Mucilaginibacter sp.]
MKKVILLIEDNQAIRESAAELLMLDGYDVLQADSGELALPMIEADKPDLIICDIVMSGIDGYEVYSYLRRTHNNIPFIFSTAKSEKRDRQKAIDMGVRYYLTKPFDEMELLQCIERCLLD